MIRFSCPACQSVVTVPPEKAGIKMPCPKCGQRLQVPVPDINKTVLGALISADPKAIAKAGAPAGAAAAVAAPPGGHPPTPAPTPAPAKEPSWFYVRQGQRQGPVGTAQLRDLVKSGQVKQTDLVWTEGMPNWEPARAVSQRLEPEPQMLGIQPSPSPSPRTPAGHAAQPFSIPPRSRPQGTRLPMILIAGGLGGLLLCGILGLGLVLLLNHGSSRSTTDSSRAEQTPTQATEPTDTELSTEKLVELCKPSVARISSPQGGGTGFLVSKDLLVTNSHVVSHSLVDQLKIYFPSAGEGGKTALTGELIYEDPQRDLAILRISTKQKPLRVADTFTVKGGERIVVIGSPAATAGDHIILENAVTQGVMSTEAKLNDLGWYQLNATINPGNSGGPVFDARGRVIGVVTRKAVGDRQEGIGFAVPLPDLRKAIERASRADKSEMERTVSLHNAGVLFRRLAFVGRVHIKMMQHVAKRMDEAMANKGTAQEGYNRALREIGSDLQLLDAQLKELRPAIPRILSDPNVRATTRDALEKLYKVDADIIDNIERPQNAGLFKNRMNTLADEYAKQVQDLKTLTGVEDLD